MTKKYLLGKRISTNRYIGLCTKTHHLAILNSKHGTYCIRHRLQKYIGSKQVDSRRMYYFAYRHFLVIAGNGIVFIKTPRAKPGTKISIDKNG